MSIPELVAVLLQEVAAMSDICLVVGSPAAVCEAFVDPGTMDFRVEGTFVTLENGPWHIHLDQTRVHKITFEVKPDTAHNIAQLSYSMRCFGANDEAIMSAFFLAMYDERGELRPERLRQYETLRARGGNRDVIWCGGEPR